LVVPAIVSVFNEKPSVLVGSVFLMYLATALAGLAFYSMKGLVDTRSGIILSIPCIPGVVIGTLLETSISEFEFKLGLGILTIALAVMMLLFKERNRMIEVSTSDEFKRSNESKARPKLLLADSSGRKFEYTPNFPAGLFINFIGGLLSGLFGAGAAILIVPAMILFVKFPAHVAIATSRIILTILNFTAFFTHVGLNAINYYYACFLAIGAVIGSMLGAKVAFGISANLLSRIVALILIILGAYLVITPFV